VSGPSTTSSRPALGASTVTEANGSDKVGSGGPPIGKNKTIGPLDRVRVDSSGQPLTTNQGVPVAGNQHSLKSGLRGPGRDGGARSAAKAFMNALASHRHYGRETDPPAV
jgi:hypothetical protein